MSAAVKRGNEVHATIERYLRDAREFASTSAKIEGALWRDRMGVTHVIKGWNLLTYDQMTRCNMAVRYRRGEWLYEALGFAPRHPNCITCASGLPVERYEFHGTITGRMSSRGPNLQPMPPRTR